MALLPALSAAIASMMAGPLATEALFHGIVYGKVDTTPTAVPLTWNSTSAILSASEALAVSVAVPCTVAPAAGDVDGRLNNIEGHATRIGQGEKIHCDGTG